LLAATRANSSGFEDEYGRTGHSMEQCRPLPTVTQDPCPPLEDEKFEDYMRNWVSTFGAWGRGAIHEVPHAKLYPKHSPNHMIRLGPRPHVDMVQAHIGAL